ncbi:MAG: hypothetical protein RQ824_10755 [bacterium]|nr:hypothetical protein [bacterium]
MLGKLILKDGAISQAQLDEAIQNQVVFGGRLGTSLVELGYISIGQLGEYLAKMHGVPTVDHQEIKACSKGVINTLGKKMATKYQCVPLSVDKSSMDLLMMDPADLAAIDEISFATSKRIKPHVASEMVIMSLLEKYYDIARPMRFISFTNKIVEEPPMAVPKAGISETAPVPEVKDEKGGLDLSRYASEDEDATEEIIDINELIQIAPSEEIMESAELAEELEEEDNLELLEELPELLNLEEARQRLSEVDDRDELSRIVLSFAHSYFKRSALFITRLGKVVGWYGMGDGINATMVKSVMLPLDEPSIFKTVFDSQAFFLGAIPQTNYNDLFLKAIGGEKPQSAFLIPILFNGRVVNILYGDNGEGQPAPFDISELLILAPKVPLAFEQLILKKKNQSDRPPV